MAIRQRTRGRVRDAEESPTVRSDEAEGADEGKGGEASLSKNSVNDLSSLPS